MIEFIQILITGTLTGLVYGLVALSFVVIYRAARIVNLAQGEILVVCAFLVWSATDLLGLPIWLGVPVALLGAVVFAFTLERSVFRPLIGQPSFTVVMASIALLILLRGVVQTVWGAETRPFPAVLPSDSLHLGPFLVNKALLVGGVLTVALTLGLHWFFMHTREGLRLAAVAEDQHIALSLGVSVRRATTIAWILGTTLATLGAIVLLSDRLLALSASEIGLRALPVALLGGLESVRGAPLAGVLIGIGEAFASAYLDPHTNGVMSQAFPYLIMLVVLLVRPQGLFGWKVIERI